MRTLAIGSLLSTIVYLSVAISPVFAADGNSLTGNPQCPMLPTFIAKLTSNVPDLGGGKIYDESDATVEPIGSGECPSHSATQCEKLAYLSFIFGLLDMSPQNFRRPGLASFMANAGSEDSSFGGSCTAEMVTYSGKNVRDNFSLAPVFCSPGSASFETGKRARMVRADGSCDTSDEALARLKTAIIAENPTLANRPGYNVALAPIVARMYRHNTGGASDEDGFLYRGRGFIQMTGRGNYQSCQQDVEQAARYLAANPSITNSIIKITGVDWRALDVVKTPEAVSQFQYVGALCAASYWKSRVAKLELQWMNSEDRFKAIVGAINQGGASPEKRRPAFTTWCRIVGCDKNFRTDLDFQSGFGTLIRLANAGAIVK